MPDPRPVRPLLDALRTADWLTRDRAAAWGVILLIEELLIVGFLALWQHGVFTTVHNPPSSDFVSFYAAGKLALAGTPALAYDQAGASPGRATGVRRRRGLPVFLLPADLPAAVRPAGDAALFRRLRAVPDRDAGAVRPGDARHAARAGLALCAGAAGVSGGVLDAGGGTERVPDRRAVRRLHPADRPPPGLRPAHCSACSATSRISACWRRSPWPPDGAGGRSAPPSPRWRRWSASPSCCSAGRPGRPTCMPSPAPARCTNPAPSTSPASKPRSAPPACSAFPRRAGLRVSSSSAPWRWSR